MVFLGVDLGLLVAVLYSLITVILRTQKPDCVLMGRVPGTDIYRDVSIIQVVSIGLYSERQINNCRVYDVKLCDQFVKHVS